MELLILQVDVNLKSLQMKPEITSLKVFVFVKGQYVYGCIQLLHRTDEDNLKGIFN